MGGGWGWVWVCNRHWRGCTVSKQQSALPPLELCRLGLRCITEYFLVPREIIVRWEGPSKRHKGTWGNRLRFTKHSGWSRPGWQGSQKSFQISIFCLLLVSPEWLERKKKVKSHCTWIKEPILDINSRWTWTQVTSDWGGSATAFRCEKPCLWRWQRRVAMKNTHSLNYGYTVRIDLSWEGGCWSCVEMR